MERRIVGIWGWGRELGYGTRLAWLLIVRNDIWRGGQYFSKEKIGTECKSIMPGF